MRATDDLRRYRRYLEQGRRLHPRPRRRRAAPSTTSPPASPAPISTTSRISTCPPTASGWCSRCAGRCNQDAARLRPADLAHLGIRHRRRRPAQHHRRCHRRAKARTSRRTTCRPTARTLRPHPVRLDAPARFQAVLMTEGKTGFEAQTEDISESAFDADVLDADADRPERIRQISFNPEPRYQSDGAGRRPHPLHAAGTHRERRRPTACTCTRSIRTARNCSCCTARTATTSAPSTGHRPADQRAVRARRARCRTAASGADPPDRRRHRLRRQPASSSTSRTTSMPAAHAPPAAGAAGASPARRRRRPRPTTCARSPGPARPAGASTPPSALGRHQPHPGELGAVPPARHHRHASCPARTQTWPMRTCRSRRRSTAPGCSIPATTPSSPCPPVEGVMMTGHRLAAGAHAADLHRRPLGDSAAGRRRPRHPRHPQRLRLGGRHEPVALGTETIAQTIARLSVTAAERGARASCASRRPYRSATRDLNDGFPDFDRNIALDHSPGYMREILGYVPIEPDGSVRVRCPPTSPSARDHSTPMARRIGFPQHRTWQQLRPGEVAALQRLPLGGAGSSHGRADVAADGAFASARCQRRLFAFPDRAARRSPSCAGRPWRRRATAPAMPTGTPDASDATATSAATPSVNVDFTGVWLGGDAEHRAYAYSSLSTPRPTEPRLRQQLEQRLPHHDQLRRQRPGSSNAKCGASSIRCGRRARRRRRHRHAADTCTDCHAVRARPDMTCTPR